MIDALLVPVGPHAAPVAASAGPAKTYYVTERSNRAIASVTVDASGRSTVDNNYITGLPPSGPDSIVFDLAGNLLVSNTEAGTIEQINPVTKQVLKQQVNNVLIPTVADLALDPSGKYVWAIGYSRPGIWKISLADGTTTEYGQNVLIAMGGLAFNQMGTRLFASSHQGVVYEVSPLDGSVVRKSSVRGAPDGMTFDPVTGHLFASGCGGLCEFGIGTETQPELTLITVVTAQDGDGIAADGTGKVIVTHSFCCLSLVDPSTNTATLFATQINSADDVAPVVGAGAPPSDITLATDSGGPNPAADSQPVGTSETLTATVRATDGGAQPGITVTFVVVSGPDAGLTGTAMTDIAGQARFSYAGKSTGPDDIVARFTDSSNTVHTSNDAIVTWTGADQPVTATGKAVAATEGQPFAGQVAALNDPDPTATAGDYLATIDWGDGSASSNASITGTGGTFAISGTHLYTDEGSYTATTTVTDADNLLITATASSRVTVADASLSAIGVASTSPQAFDGIVATFTDADNTSTVADFTATLDWGDGSGPSQGTVTQTGSTYAVRGSHTYGTTGPVLVKAHIVDDGGSVADATDQLVVFGKAAGGNFVISDRSAVVGDTVTFWGAQWSKNNLLSGGSAPASFKGFEDDPATAACLRGWTTDPGNSTPPPPGPLPSYMAVIVSSSITKSGSSISGDAVGVVVVKTADGYAPDPGHPGTGVVVRAVCPAGASASVLTADNPPSYATAGNPYSYTFAASGTPAPSFGLASGTLPDGLSLDPTSGLLSGTPTVAGVFTFTVKAVNGSGPDAVSPALTIVVTAPPVPPTFTADSPPTTVRVGAPYTYRFAASGTPAPSFGLASGALPGGFELDAPTGVLSGTPAVPGVFTFTVKATNGVSPDAVSPTLTITVVLPPSFTADSPPTTAKVGTAYSYTFAAAGFPAPTFAVASGTLPGGLSLDLTSGVLSGTPTAPGVFTFTVKATNGVSPDAVSPTLTITVVLPPSFTADSPPTTAKVGTAYSYTFAAAGFPAPTFAVASGTLPGGLNLDPDSGALTGTPTTQGVFTFTVKATNGTPPDAVSPALTITVTAPPTFTADIPPVAGAVRTAYSYTFAATGTPAPTFAVASGTLPDGLSLNPDSGALTGTPTTAGVFTFTVKAANGVSPDAISPAITITVSASGVSPAFTADNPPATATAGTPYSYTFAATGTPAPTFAVASGALPDGLSLNPASGLLSGTPSATGTFTFTVKATNGVSPDAISPTLTVAVSQSGPPGPPTVTGQSYTVPSGSELDVSAPGVLTDATSPRNPPLTALFVNNNALGVVVLRGDGSFSYVPPAGFTGIDTFTFQARDNVGALSNVATVSINVTAGGPPSPALNTVSPTAGTTITGPTTITATLTPPTGQSITGWTVSYHRPQDPTVVQLATGTGPSVSASFDSTLLRDGTYAIVIRAQASGGGVLETESGLIVDGGYKPGRYATTFHDLTVDAANIPIDLRRTYDSADLVSGDFGAGWTLGMTDFRVDTNGPLGAGGWTSASCGFFGTSVCYSSTLPHRVTVTWPDGHVERFDMTPANGSFFLPTITTAAFTAEPGSTSTLAALDNGIVRSGSNFLEGGFFATNGIYDPLQFVLTAKNGTQYTLDRHAGLLGIADRNGNTITVDGGGIHASSGPSVAFHRDAANRITQIVGPAGTIDYTYSPAGDLIGVHYPNGATQSFTYDARHSLLTISGGGQLVRTLHYDAAGRITAVTDGNGKTSTISTDVAGHQQAVTDPSGALTTVYTFDGRGDLIQQDQTFAGKTVTTKATYDPLGQQLSVTDPLGHKTSQTYDAAGNVLTQTDANGNTTTFTYNALGEPLTVTDATKAVTHYTYDAVGDLLTVTDPNGNVTTNTYDHSGHLLTTTDPTGSITTRTYDGSGQLASITNPGGNTSHQTVDAATGHVTSTTDPAGGTTTFAYDADGNLTGITDANGHARTTVYDSFDRAVSSTDPSGAVTHLTYDAAGNLISVTDRNAATITYTYDADSRLTAKTVPGGGTTTYTYDPLGRMVGAANTNAQLAFSYDDAGNLRTVTTAGTATSALPTVTFTYTYDPAGNRLSTQGPGGTIGYAYNSARQLTTLTDPSGGAFTLGYDQAGQLTSLTRPNSVNDTIAYDKAGNLTSLRSTLGATLVNQADYTYNTAGLRSSLTTTAGTTSYTYDSRSELTSATYPTSVGLPADTYTYDRAGNRTSTATAPLGSFTYDASDRLLSDAATTYVYDKEGNLLTRAQKATGAQTSYTWSADHQLTGIAYPDGTTTALHYDPLGRRVEIDEGSTVTRYAYDQQNIAAEYDATNTLIASYVPNPTATGQILEMTRGGQRYFYLDDAQGSTTALTTLTGTVAASYTYSAFGTPAENGSLANRFTYTGQPYDAKAGLLLFPLRADDPGLGRFISEDPLPSANPYIYTSNQPTVLVDPTGAQEETEYTAVNYRSRFAALRKLPKGWQVHHGLPQKFANLLREAYGINVHYISFLRGVAPEVHYAITAIWESAFPAGSAFLAEDVLVFAEYIDLTFGEFFIFA